MCEVDDILNNKELNPSRKVELPCSMCDGDCCGPIPLTKSFIKDMWRKHNLNKKIGSIKKVKYISNGLPNRLMFYIEKDRCVFKTTKGCAIYTDRPSICKVYGETHLVRCPYENLDQQPTDSATKQKLVTLNNTMQQERLLELVLKTKEKEC